MVTWVDQAEGTGPRWQRLAEWERLPAPVWIGMVAYPLVQPLMIGWERRLPVLVWFVSRPALFVLADSWDFVSGIAPAPVCARCRYPPFRPARARHLRCGDWFLPAQAGLTEPTLSGPGGSV